VDSQTLSAHLLTDPPGVIEAPASPDPHVVIHVGRSVKIECKRGGQTHRGTAIHGDVDILPAHTESRWTIWERDTALIVRIPQDLLTQVAQESGFDPEKVLVNNRFQIRDPQIEQLAWALKGEMDCQYESGRLYLDSLGVAMASRLLHRHSSASQIRTTASRGGLPGAKLRRVLGFIEDNLANSLSLPEIAAASGLSISHCQRAFRQSVGVSVHQYVIRRRVERAESLLTQEKLSVAQIALEVGFAHQSHLAIHMRRLRGVTPTRHRRSTR
jgi:AraC family transcriptional regulator